MVGRAHIRAAAAGGLVAAAVVGAGVLVAPMLRAPSNPVKEAALARWVEGQATASRGPGQAKGVGAPPNAKSGVSEPGLQPKPSSSSLDESTAKAPGSTADAPRSSKVRRIEDLPAASPVAYRPLRADELPEVPGSGKRARAGKEGVIGQTPAPADSKGAAVATGGALRIEDLPSVSAAVRPLRNDELNPELIKRADDLLWNHPSPVGVDVPLEVKGKSYIARFAYHYHEFGSAKKPWGYHKGVTLYATE